ncbi:hypothetical protein ACFW5W_07145 [Streptomyces sp. NPDC058783]|uniref:hypothetical protein n=1 Tax=Streptomyces sp. NPDC058783 TaxID=3346633 RepID=UPI0036900D18
MSTPTPAAPAAPAAPSTPAAPQAPAAPSAPAAPATPPAPTAPPSTPPAPTTPPAAPAAPAPAQGEPGSLDHLDQATRDYITSLRAEAASWRVKAQGTAPQAPVAPVEPAAPAAPAEVDVSRLPKRVQEQVQTGQAAVQQLAIQTALIQAAPAAGADLAALLDSQSAMQALAAVNPADATAVTAAITAAVQANPRLAAQPTPPARGGADFGNQGAGEITPAAFAAMDYQARTELYQSDPETYRRLAGS